MSGESQRWQGQRSDFPWEQDALEHIKAQMPDAEPYRAWQTFTFTAGSGHVREVDLFIATPGGLFLVEIKSHPGTATNNGSTWLFRDGGKTRTIENPLHFTDQKAKELKDQLERAARQLNVREPIPRIEAAVFLSAENLVCQFDEFQRQRVYGRDELDEPDGPARHLERLPQPAAGSERNRVTPTLSKQLPKLLQKIGIARAAPDRQGRPLRAGGQVLRHRPDLGGLPRRPTRRCPTTTPRRVRIYLSERTATDEDRKSVQRAAHREYLALQGISHDGIVRAEQYSDELRPGPAVVFRHGEGLAAARPLHGRATTADLPLETRLEMIRQLAEALDHAHRRHLYHRALAPRSVYVELDGRYPRLRIADWQVAARPHGTAWRHGPQAGTASGPAHGRRRRDRSASTSSGPPAPTSRRSSRTPEAAPRCSTSSASARSAT